MRFDVIDVNLIKKLSELVSAKALWFSLLMPIALHPGPSRSSTNSLPRAASETLARNCGALRCSVACPYE
ncbi:hypothetical protein [Duganella sp. Dugasp56]|uniref:hypothetical protein n=1 Tax=Duganella sp. Dugasp56 TaxID=3243046 RepID=UPI0039AF8140